MGDVCFWEKVVKTNKPHQCWGCMKTIYKGTRALRSVMQGGGGVYSVYMCSDCRYHLDICEACEDSWHEGDLQEGGIRDCDRRLDL